MEGIMAFYPFPPFAFLDYSPYTTPYPPFPYPYHPPLAQLPSSPTMSPQLAASTTDREPSRAVLLSLVPSHVTESSVMQAMMLFGLVRAVDSGFLTTLGTVTVHFYDLRSAELAVTEICNQYVQQNSRLWQEYLSGGSTEAPSWDIGGGWGLVDGHAVWAQFGADVFNQGSLLVVSVSDRAKVSIDGLRETFEAFGNV